MIPTGIWYRYGGYPASVLYGVSTSRMIFGNRKIHPGCGAVAVITDAGVPFVLDVAAGFFGGILQVAVLRFKLAFDFGGFFRIHGSQFIEHFGFAGVALSRAPWSSLYSL